MTSVIPDHVLYVWFMTSVIQDLVLYVWFMTSVIPDHLLYVWFMTSVIPDHVLYVWFMTSVIQDLVLCVVWFLTSVISVEFNSRASFVRFVPDHCFLENIALCVWTLIIVIQEHLLVFRVPFFSVISEHVIMISCFVRECYSSVL